MRARTGRHTSLLLTVDRRGVGGRSPAAARHRATPRGGSCSAAQTAPQEEGGQDEFGPYEPVANWPQPLPDGPDGVKHDGWTWGSVGAIYAETPDRIWIAQRGELPLPPGRKPWTPYAMLTVRRAATPRAMPTASSATCEADREARMGAAVAPFRVHRRIATASWSTNGRSWKRCSRRTSAAAVRTRSR